MTHEALFTAARAGDLTSLTMGIDADPTLLHAKEKPYGWSLLHAAAHKAQLDVVEFLLARGLDPNTKEDGDHTTAMHWAAAAGSAPVVRALAGAGCDVIGHGDDHALEVIGWATCWDGCDDEAHREVVGVLLEFGAHHHIFSAIAMNLGDEVRRIVAADRGALHHTRSKHEHHELPLHFAIQKNRGNMVRLLLDLGADPRATCSAGISPAGYASWSRVNLEIIRLLFDRGLVTPFTALTVGDYAAAESLVRDDPLAIDREGTLHMIAKRGDMPAVRWLLDHGANPNALWNHWDAHVTPLHMAIMENQPDVVRLLLDRGADPSIRDSMYDGDAMGWAEHFENAAVIELLKPR